ncbi:hypothetical protein GGS23DRAFT_544505 [Durotheca rogersii]|uniref:uncharacterized protein n=1 Tax=Durotheca rogersii TaxID=419775 RepID=UPI00221F4726|nr:uncharacterized protein GGS23DRAFT_544505 [Durotheca rogersii]KAI5868201.1 hypothetical protein GGS23DRAFT_544505 [Durotheca rogersii]
MVAGTSSRHLLRKSLFTGLHQPLPLSRREGQQLLEAITASFRKNLDKEHPWPSNDEEPVPSQDNCSASGSPRRQTLPSSPSSLAENAASTTAQHPADRHLRAILCNPLFAHQRVDDKPTKNFTLTHVTTPDPTPDPFDVFDRAVSRGLMTSRRAAGFLTAVRSRIAASDSGTAPDSNIRQRMAASGAALRVVQWLRASGQEHNLDFIYDFTLIRTLVPFMYAEGLEEVVWAWVARGATRVDVWDDTVASGRALSFLLYALMLQTSEPRLGGQIPRISLDASYSAMARATKVLHFPENKQGMVSLRRPWAFLSWASTVDAWDRPKPSAPLFDAFVDIGRPFGVPLDMAHLQLHHPLHPSHSAAVEYMHANANMSFDDEIATANLPKQARRRLVCLALDTVDRLKEAGDTTEVSWVERFLTRICEDLNLNIFNIPPLPGLLSEPRVRNMD